LIESIAMNRDFWPKSAKIAKLDDFIAIERTIMGLINRDLIVDFQAILITWDTNHKIEQMYLNNVCCEIFKRKLTKDYLFKWYYKISKSYNKLRRKYKLKYA
jgi:hypothetical protein